MEQPGYRLAKSHSQLTRTPTVPHRRIIARAASGPSSHWSRHSVSLAAAGSVPTRHHKSVPHGNGHHCIEEDAAQFNLSRVKACSKQAKTDQEKPDACERLMKAVQSLPEHYPGQQFLAELTAFLMTQGLGTLLSKVVVNKYLRDKPWVQSPNARAVRADYEA